MLQYAADAAVESLNFPSLLCLGEEPLEIMAPQDPWEWYISLPLPKTSTIHVGKYTMMYGY